MYRMTPCWRSSHGSHSDLLLPPSGSASQQDAPVHQGARSLMWLHPAFQRIRFSCFDHRVVSCRSDGYSTASPPLVCSSTQVFHPFVPPHRPRRIPSLALGLLGSDRPCPLRLDDSLCASDHRFHKQRRDRKLHPPSQQECLGRRDRTDLGDRSDGLPGQRGSPHRPAGAPATMVD